jgi:hypothetical protein
VGVILLHNHCRRTQSLGPCASVTLEVFALSIPRSPSFVLHRPSEPSWTLFLLRNHRKLCVSPVDFPVVLVGPGSCFFLAHPEDQAYALVPWPFPDIFLSHSEDCFNSSEPNCNIPGVGCCALGSVESFDLQGIGQASHSL